MASPRRRALALAVATACATLLPAAVPTVRAEDVSAPAILQWFDGTYATMEKRTADVFAAGYGAVWSPPPGRADSGNQSVGYDVFDRFDLGAPRRPTLYGTETGIKRAVSSLHRAGVDFHIDFVLNHNGFSDQGRPGFVTAGDYPGFVLTLPNDIDGDFHGAFEGGDHNGRTSNLIDIAQEKNHQFIRHPVDPSDPRNIPAGTVTDRPDVNNRRFYPDADGSFITLDDPATGATGLRIYRFDPANPAAGDPVPENATALLMRNAQWLVQTVGVDGFRIDAAKHVPPWVMNFHDRAVFRSSLRTSLDGSPRHVFSYSEVFDGNKDLQRDYIRKDIASPNVVGGNRDVLDFPQFFALKDNLTNNGLANDWRNVVGAGMDVHDDGKHNGSQGVLFAASHDTAGPELSNVAHAYTLMHPGNAVVYFNGKEHGGTRDFPKDGRGDALGGQYGDAITTLTTLRNTHGRGDYRERHLSKEFLAFERSGSALVMLSNRNDGGASDWMNLNVDLPFGTPLVELTGNAAAAGLPELLTVTDDFFGGPKYVRAKFLNNDGADRGYLVYGLAGPQGSLDIQGKSRTLAPETPSASTNGTARLSAVDVITADAFTVALDTTAVNLLGAVRDRDADGDNALLKIDGGLDVNGSGAVDFVTPGSVVYGFEQFTTQRQPGYVAADGNGGYAQAIDASDLSEGYHYVEVRAFRHRDDGGPAVYTPFKRTIYVDRLKPVAGIDEFAPVAAGVNENRELLVRSLDGTADNVHVLLDLPAALSDAEVLARINGATQTDRIDRDLWAERFDGLTHGNHVATLVTFEITGNLNVQRVAGLFTSTIFGAGLGDVNFDGGYAPSDIDAMASLVQSLNAQFNPAGDLSADGLIDLFDWQLLGLRLDEVNADAPTRQRYAELSGTVPEPAGVAVVAIAAAALMRRRRRR